METMQLIPTTKMDITLLTDEAIEAFFASAGLTGQIVEHCDCAACPVCFDQAPARAA